MADPNTPSWLQEDNDSGFKGDTPIATAEPVPAPAAAPVIVDSGTTNATAATAGSQTLSTTQVDEEDLPRMIFIMRLANIGAAIALVVCSIFEIVRNPAKIGSVVLAVYALFGGMLICCLETQLKFLRIMIAVNFGFLFNAIFRFLFNGILGSVAWTFDGLFGKIVGVSFGVVGLFNTYVLCKYPSFRKMREEIAREEDKKIEERIRKQVRKQAVLAAAG